MSTAKVIVLHQILTSAGWVSPSLAPVSMPADEARQFESTGKVDVLEVDGVAEVWYACCSGVGHGH